MTNIVLKPELRTNGGETVSVYCNDEWAGDVYLIYREGDTMTGTIQIDNNRIAEHDLEAVETEVRSYIQHLSSALAVENSSVVMMYGDISTMVEMEPYDVVDEDTYLAEDDTDAIYAMDDDDLLLDTEMDMIDEDDNGAQVIYLNDDEEDEDFEYGEDDTYETVYDMDDDCDEDDMDDYVDERYVANYVIDDTDGDNYHLSVVYKNGEHTKYHLHTDEHQAVGVVAVDEIGGNVSGRVEFWEEPDELETNDVACMLAREFGTNEVDNLSFTMNYEDTHLGDMYLNRGDAFDEAY